MLTTQGETSESEILNRIKSARGGAEPEKSEPAESTEVVDVSIEAPVEDDEAEAVAEVETSEAEESEQVGDGGEHESAQDEDLYVEFKGREINLKDVEEWEQGHLRQSDYTRKTQELADQRKDFESKQEEFNSVRSKLDGQVALLEQMIAEDQLSPEQIAEMREYEPESYIQHQEKMQKRKDALAEAKGMQPVSNVDVEAERAALWKANPSWMDNGKQTQAFTDDMALLQDYAQASGYSNDEIKAISTSRHWQTLLDAAKYQSVSKKNAAIEKKVRKAPVTTKPRKAAVSNIQDQIKKAQAKLKKTGRAEDAVALRKLKRQL